MEILFEMIMQLFFEAGFEASESSRVPLWVRILLISTLFIIFLGIGGLLFATAIFMKSENLLSRFVVGGIGFLLIIFSIGRIFSFVKNIRKK